MKLTLPALSQHAAHAVSTLALLAALAASPLVALPGGAYAGGPQRVIG